MEVKPGYKKTEVGVIPDDWIVRLLPDVCRFRGGKAHEQHISDLGKFVCVNSKFISTDGKVRKHSTANFCSAKRGDILMVMSDLPNGKALAKAYVADQDNLYAVNQRICALTPYRDDSRYLYYVLNRNPYFLKFDDGVNQTHLLNPVFKKCLLSAPPTKAEQEAIAEVLSDADALIDSLEQILAKKRNLKQGAMLGLLTGKKRLPGFSGKWEVTRLGDVCRITTGKRDVNEGNPEGQFPFFTCSRSHTFSDSYSFDTEAILIAGNGEVGNLHYFKGKFEAYQRTYVLSQFSGPVGYLWQQLSAYLADSLGLGKIGSSIPYIKMESLIGFEFNSPKDEPEQTAIATILSDMDAEIAALEAKLAKARQLKQGMMQELLTGRIRLV
ncbi:MAG: restriction endonuclease subunit S [Nitrospira sp.]|nr:restriction endonuclease subunit S [Nitrospira sp.]